MEVKSYDVIVVGGGNAAFCAAISALEQGAKVLVLERAPEEKRGGNTSFTGGTFRTVYNGLEDINKIVPDLSAQEIAQTDFGEYTEEQFLDDIGRVTQYHTDPDLAEALVRNSLDTVLWLSHNGVRFVPNFGRQAFNHEGRFKFIGGFVLATVGGGRGLVDGEAKTARAKGATVRYNAHVTGLLHGRSGVEGVRVTTDGVQEEIHARAVVLACGGFESNREWRTRYLGPGWDLAKVRGTRYNTGDGLRMALDIGAQPYGQWSGCHTVAWDRYAPDYGDPEVDNNRERNCYQFSIMVDAEGKRFVDEGADFRNFTYAKLGRAVIQQPGGYAWQVFDDQCDKYLRSEYKRRGATKVTANTLEELAPKLEGVNAEGFLKTAREYNAAVTRDVPFNPNIKDGRRTVGLTVPKSNWANPLEVPPFQAYFVGAGVTFTFGGVKVDTSTRVLDMADVPLRGLYAAGEMVGGIFYFNYPGGSGLMSGAVFGRIAGREAGKFARAASPA